MSSLTIVMYHYVRESAGSRYPAIKARKVSDFRAQLEHIGRCHPVVTAQQVMDALAGGPALPDNAAWLTFDDGYLDHYRHVFPLLVERGWQGSFFAPARAVVERELLDVNKIHYILAAQPDTAAIITRLRDLHAEFRGDAALPPFEERWNELARPSRYDPAPVVFIKQMLQHGLPERARSTITDALLRAFVPDAPADLADETYMTVEQIREMVRSSMYFGSHGYSHRWLDRLPDAEQREEIARSIEFLRLVGAPTERWVMCYPYGVSDPTLRDSVRRHGGVAGITVEARTASIGTDDPFLLPRLDTNDIPVARAS